jgi:hypothetical protein
MTCHECINILKNHIVWNLWYGFDVYVVEKLSDQYIDFICYESLTCRCLNLNPGHFHSSAILPLFV